MIDSRSNRLRGGEKLTVAVIGLGYVGLPLALAFARDGNRVIGIDVDAAKVRMVTAGQSPFRHLSDQELTSGTDREDLTATTDTSAAGDADVVIICVPTPLNDDKSPNLSALESAAVAVARSLTPGQLVVIESTSWPGTTDEVIRPILEESGLTSGKDFFLAFSPEREDPGNPHFTTVNIPKVVGADDAISAEFALSVYGRICQEVVPVASSRIAEAAKLTENVFRSVNIALVNELKALFAAMDIDVWEVLSAASTKPFGFMAFDPGPGVGGHCIPVDPHYLLAKARAHAFSARLIDLATSINDGMPDYVIGQLLDALDRRRGIGLRDSRILVVGVAYKKNVEDARQSPSLALLALLAERGAIVTYFDPYVEADVIRQHGLEVPRLQSLMRDALGTFDAVLIATDHADVDYQAIVDGASLIVDTRNVFARLGIQSDRIIKA